MSIKHGQNLQNKEANQKKILSQQGDRGKKFGILSQFP
jgi:hypothetical protein